MRDALLRAHSGAVQCRMRAVSLLRLLGYKGIPIEAIKGSGDEDTDGFVVEEILSKQVARLNRGRLQGLATKEKERRIGHAMEALNCADSLDPVGSSRVLYENLVVGAPSEGSDSQRLAYIDWVDPGRNLFQFAIGHGSEDFDQPGPTLADLVCFVNGVPLVRICFPATLAPIEFGGGSPRYGMPSPTPSTCQIFIVIYRDGACFTTPENSGQRWLSWPSGGFEEDWILFGNTMRAVTQNDEACRIVDRTDPQDRVLGRPMEWLMWSVCRPYRLLDLLKRFRIPATRGQAGGIVDGRTYASIRSVIARLKQEGENKAERVQAIWRPESRGFPGLLEFTVRALVFDPEWKQEKILIVLPNESRRESIESALCLAPRHLHRTRSSNELSRLLETSSFGVLIATFDQFGEAMERCSIEVRCLESWIVIADGITELSRWVGSNRSLRVPTLGRLLIVSDVVFRREELQAIEDFGLESVEPLSRTSFQEVGELVPVYFEDRSASVPQVSPSSDRGDKTYPDAGQGPSGWWHGIARELVRELGNENGRSGALVVVVPDIVDAFVLKEILDERKRVKSIVLEEGSGGLACFHESGSPNAGMAAADLQGREAPLRSGAGKCDRDILLVSKGMVRLLRRSICRAVYLVGPLDYAQIAKVIEIVDRPEPGKDFGLLISFDKMSSRLVEAYCTPHLPGEINVDAAFVGACRRIRFEVDRLPEHLTELEAIFPACRDRNDPEPYEAVLRSSKQREEFLRLFHNFHRCLFLAHSSAAWRDETVSARRAAYGDVLRFFQSLRIRSLIRYAEDLDRSCYEEELRLLLGVTDADPSRLSYPQGLNALRLEPFDSLVGSMTTPTARGDMLVCWTLRTIRERREGTDPPLSELARKVESTVAGFTEGQLTPSEYQSCAERALRTLRGILGVIPQSRETETLRGEIRMIVDRTLLSTGSSGFSSAGFVLREGRLNDRTLRPGTLDRAWMDGVAGRILEIIERNRSEGWTRSRIVQNRMRREIDAYLMSLQAALGGDLEVAALDNLIEASLVAARRRLES